MLSVIIVAAGSSRRMGFDKLMAPLGTDQKPVLWHTIQSFIQSDLVDEIILVSTQERFEELQIQSDKLSLALGGKDRHNSVANGIAQVSSQATMIAVHDGARPFVSQQLINDVLNAAKTHSAATSARRVTETVKRSNNEQFSTTSVDRENLWLMETPQIFDAQKLRDAYDEVEQADTLVTDEVSAMEKIGTSTYLVENTSIRPNLKITYPHDLKVAELYLTQDSSSF